jgi:short subunit dehydrogenase-like uncharacterized protein
MQLMIYGATGYTGRLITDRAIRLGLRPVLGGRDGVKLAAFAQSLGLEYRTARLDHSDDLRNALQDIKLVLHAAGPFSATAAAMLDACLHCGAHYLDLSGEMAVIEQVVRRDAAARARRIMLMPATGFDVVASDCLAAHVAARLPSATSLALGFSGLRLMTRGSAKTIVENEGIFVRRNGAIVAVTPGSIERDFDFGAGPRRALNVTWGDVASAYYTTGIPNVEVYFEATPMLRSVLAASRFLGPMLRTDASQAMLKLWAELLPAGPTEAERSAQRTAIVAEARDAHGGRAAARLHAPEPYSFTALSAAAIAQRALAGDVEIGFQTPARVYGPDLALAFDGVTREDLA